MLQTNAKSCANIVGGRIAFGFVVFRNGASEYDMIHDEELKVVAVMAEHFFITGDFKGPPAYPPCMCASATPGRRA